MFTFSGTYSLPKNWDVSAKFRVVGGAPYTPYDVERSSYVEAWDANNQLLYDYSRFNSERLDPFTQLDLRVDKTFYFKKSSSRSKLWERSSPATSRSGGGRYSASAAAPAGYPA